MKFYLIQNMNYPVPQVPGKEEIQFVEAVYMHGTGSMWGTFQTDDAEIQAAFASAKHIQEISEADFNSYEVQRRKRPDYATVFHVSHRGMATEMKGSAVAVTVDEPPASLPRAEAVDEILATKVTSKRGK